MILAKPKQTEGEEKKAGGEERAVLAKGAMSVVYRSERDPVGEVYKEALPGDPASRRYLRKEARRLVALSHPNIIRAIGFDEALSRLYLPYCPEGDLYGLIYRKGPLSEAVTRPLYRQMLLGLGYLHGSGLCHCDIKPENFLLRDGTVLLIDLGLSKRITPEGVKTGSGTVRYVAPELFDVADRPFDGVLADLYSMGVVLYVMVKGENMYDFDEGEAPPGSPAYDRLVRAIKGEPIPALAPGLGSDDIRGTLRRLLDKEPSKRHRSCEDVLKEPWLDHESVSRRIKEEVGRALVSGVPKIVPDPWKPRNGIQKRFGAVTKGRRRAIGFHVSGVLGIV